MQNPLLGVLILYFHETLYLHARVQTLAGIEGFSAPSGAVGEQAAAVLISAFSSIASVSDSIEVGHAPIFGDVRVGDLDGWGGGVGAFGASVIVEIHLEEHKVCVVDGPGAEVGLASDKDDLFVFGLSGFAEVLDFVEDAVGLDTGGGCGTVEALPNRAP